MSVKIMITIQTIIKKDKDDDNDKDKDKYKDIDWNSKIKRGITCHGRKENKWKESEW